MKIRQAYQLLRPLNATLGSSVGTIEGLTRRLIGAPARIYVKPASRLISDDSGGIHMLTPDQVDAFAGLVRRSQRGDALHGMVMRYHGRRRRLRRAARNGCRTLMHRVNRNNALMGSRYWHGTLNRAVEVRYHGHIVGRAGQTGQIDGFWEATLLSGRIVHLGVLDIATYHDAEIEGREAWLDGSAPHAAQRSRHTALANLRVPAVTLTPFAVQEALLRALHEHVPAGRPLPRLQVDMSWERASEEHLRIAQQVDHDLHTRGLTYESLETLAAREPTRFMFAQPGEQLQVYHAGADRARTWHEAALAGLDANGAAEYLLPNSPDRTHTQEDALRSSFIRVTRLSDGTPATLTHLLGYEALPSDFYDYDRSPSGSVTPMTARPPEPV